MGMVFFGPKPYPIYLRGTRNPTSVEVDRILGKLPVPKKEKDKAELGFESFVPYSRLRFWV